jgi:hypothetical protein
MNFTINLSEPETTIPTFQYSNWGEAPILPVSKNRKGVKTVITCSFFALDTKPAVAYIVTVQRFGGSGFKGYGFSLFLSQVTFGTVLILSLRLCLPNEISVALISSGR